MPGEYGTDDSTPWGAAGTSYVSPGQTSSPYQPGGGSTNQGGSNALADAINVANAAPPQISASQNLQNQANIAIGQENIRRGIGKYAGQFPEYDMDQPMATGFGSVFGASSGSTASSQTVQDSLSFMIEDSINQAIKNKGGPLSADEHNNAVNSALVNFYPTDANLMDIPEGHTAIEDFYTIPSFDQDFYGMDDFDYNYYGGQGPTEASETFAGAPWSQKGLGEVLAEGPTGFGEMESIYGEEFDPEREASFLYLTGIPQFRDQTIYDYV
tara:strand:- start:190 stop:999 length:810 start_codon:yes stop_codon:yes gene_type:complete